MKCISPLLVKKLPNCIASRHVNLLISVVYWMNSVLINETIKN